MNKLVRFLIAGLPSFLIAIPLNYALVTWAGWPKPGAYAAVLLVQVTLNYFACRWFVFKPSNAVRFWSSFALFVNGILLFRLLDWGLYSLLTACTTLPFIGVQLFNVALFGLLKFEFSRRVFERKHAERPETQPPSE